MANTPHSLDYMELDVVNYTLALFDVTLPSTLFAMNRPPLLVSLTIGFKRLCGLALRLANRAFIELRAVSEACRRVSIHHKKKPVQNLSPQAPKFSQKTPPIQRPRCCRLV
jgi:hypothetical protein